MEKTDIFYLFYLYSIIPVQEGLAKTYFSFWGGVRVPPPLKID